MRDDGRRILEACVERERMNISLIMIYLGR